MADDTTKMLDKLQSLIADSQEARVALLDTVVQVESTIESVHDNLNELKAVFSMQGCREALSNR